MSRKNMSRSQRFGKCSDASKSRYSRSRRFGKRSSTGKSRFGRCQFNDVSKFVNKAISTVDAKPYEAKHSFADFLINDRLKENVLHAGYKQPTPIQDQIIPHILNGRDVVGIANTGTGKTAAFIVPLLNKIARNRKQNVLVVVPTRELAIQINQESTKFARGLNILSVCTVGGMPISRQIRDLCCDHNLVIGTPGRIKDLIERRRLNLGNFQTIVLDEADRMLDMGFIGDMRFLMSAMPTGRQTLFFSATLSSNIKRIINEFLNNPISISVKTSDTPYCVDQDVVRIKNNVKINLLHDLLIQPEFSKVLVFGRTKHGVESLSKSLSSRGFKAQSIHGNKNHNQRQRALKSFKDNIVNILVATDVAARGLDISNVSHVINYELPATYDDYIHRIGRTGRGGKTGKALTFVE